MKPFHRGRYSAVLNGEPVSREEIVYSLPFQAYVFCLPSLIFGLISCFAIKAIVPSRHHSPQKLMFPTTTMSAFSLLTPRNPHPKTYPMGRPYHLRENIKHRRKTVVETLHLG